MDVARFVDPYLDHLRESGEDNGRIAAPASPATPELPPNINRKIQQAVGCTCIRMTRSVASSSCNDDECGQHLDVYQMLDVRRKSSSGVSRGLPLPHIDL